MVFVCPTKEESENITQMAAKIKDALKDVENKLTIGVKPICVPCCVPICDYPCTDTEKIAKKENKIMAFDPPPVMVCYKEPSKKGKGKQQDKKEEGVIRLQQSKSRELRASILYTGCSCEKRNGLQDDCPRTGCHGSPECLTKPPTCGPSEFCDGKHLGKNRINNGKGANGKSKNDHGDSGEGVESEKARYKCFAATIDTPLVCCPCPPCT